MTPASWTPELRLDTRPDVCRLTLVGVTYGNGDTLQEAGNDLLVRVHDLAVGLRRGHRPGAAVGPVDPRVADFLWEIGEILSRGGDIRSRIFGG